MTSASVAYVASNKYIVIS